MSVHSTVCSSLGLIYSSRIFSVSSVMKLFSFLFEARRVKVLSVLFLGALFSALSFPLVDSANAQSTNFDYSNVRRSTAGVTSGVGRGARVNSNSFENARLNQLRREGRYKEQLVRWENRQARNAERARKQEARARAQKKAREERQAQKELQRRRKLAEKERKRQDQLAAERAKLDAKSSARDRAADEDVSDRKRDKTAKKSRSSKEKASSRSGTRRSSKKEKQSLFERFRESLFN